MEPSQTHSAPLPQQGLTYPAGGCLSEPRSGDLLQEGYEGTNPHAGPRQVCGAMDNAIAGTTYASEVTANRLEALANSSSAASEELAASKGLTRFDVFHLLNEENK